MTRSISSRLPEQNTTARFFLDVLYFFWSPSLFSLALIINYRMCSCSDLFHWAHNLSHIHVSLCGPRGAPRGVNLSVFLFYKSVFIFLWRHKSSARHGTWIRLVNKSLLDTWGTPFFLSFSCSKFRIVCVKLCLPEECNKSLK